MRTKKTSRETASIGCLLLVTLVSVPLMGWIAQSLWNWIVVSVFDLSPISFLQGIGIYSILSFVSSFFKRTSN